MGFFDRMRRSWDLVQASATVLRNDKSLMVFPLLTVVVAVVLVPLFMVPAIGIGMSSGLPDSDVEPYAYVWGFLLYVALYFVGLFFNAALVGSVMLRMDGQRGSFGDGIAVATGKIGSIFVYAIIAATVGMVMRAVAERLGVIGNFIVGLLGVVWSLAVFLVVPVLVARDVTPVAAIKESAGLLRRTWGENVAGTAGIGFVFGILLFAIIMVGGGLAALLISHDMPAGGFVLAAIAAVCACILVLVQTTLSGIFSVALYRYATTGQGSDAFPPQLLAQSFRPKGT